MPFLTQGKTNWKFLLIVVVLTIIVGGGILWCVKTSEQPYLLSETSEPERVAEDKTADWQVYRNEEYGFEIKYPSDQDSYGMDVRDDEAGLGEGIKLLIDWIPYYMSNSLIRLIVFSNPNNYTVQSNPYIFFAASPDCKNVKINGLMFCEVSGVGVTGTGMDVPYFQYYISKNGYMYNINLDLGLDEKEVLVEFNQMLSTFRFIETTQSGSKVLFVYLTDKEYDGNLGGRLGADAKCTPPVGLNCESGTVHTLITVNEDDSIMNMAENYNFNTDTPIYWYNRDTKGTLILANNWGEMINVDSNGMNSGIINGQVEGTDIYDLPWTGGLGDEDIYSCNQWTSNEGDPEIALGPYGIMGGRFKEMLFSAEGWAGISSAMVCKNQRYLFCICEGNI